VGKISSYIITETLRIDRPEDGWAGKKWHLEVLLT